MQMSKMWLYIWTSRSGRKCCCRSGFLRSMVMSADRDEVSWALEKSGRFSTKSLYRELTCGGIEDQQMVGVWGCRVPLKIQIFMLMVFHDRIQSTFQLKNGIRRVKWNVAYATIQLNGNLDGAQESVFVSVHVDIRGS